MTVDDKPYPWVSRNGFMEARLFDETAEEVTYFFRGIGKTARGVAKAISKEAFQQGWRLKRPSEDAREAEVARIMAMSDEEVLAEATPDDLAWAERFKASIRTAIVTRPSTSESGG